MIRVIFQRELRERAFKKGYLIGTAVTVAIVIGAIALPRVLADDGPTTHHLGVVDLDAAELQPSLAAMIGPGHEIRVSTVDDEGAARTLVLDGTLTVALVEDRLLSDGPAHPVIRGAVDRYVQQSALRASLERSGLDAAAIDEALQAPQPLTMIDLSHDGDGDGDGAFLIAFLATILLVVGVQMSGATLLSGALEEKSNRVVEVLVATARPWQLLTGKVLATSLLTAIQLSLVVIAALITNAAVDAFPLPAATGSVLAIAAVMLLAGFMFYAALFTVAGTLASSMEDAQSTAGPLYFAMWGAYAAVFLTVIPNPSGVVAQILTFLPPTAPFIVPARVALGDIAAWQIPVSVLVTLLGATLAVRVAGRIYAASLLAGGRLTWKAAWTSEPIR